MTRTATHYLPRIGGPWCKLTPPVEVGTLETDAERQVWMPHQGNRMPIVGLKFRDGTIVEGIEDIQRAIVLTIPEDCV